VQKDLKTKKDKKDIYFLHHFFQIQEVQSALSLKIFNFNLIAIHLNMYIIG